MLLDKNYRSIHGICADAPTTPLKFVVHVVDTIRGESRPDMFFGSLDDNDTIVVPSPADITAREVSELIIYNDDDASATVTLSLRDNADSYNFKKTTLTAGQSLTYQPVNGWQVN